MKVRLLKDARIWHKAGEILEVSPEESHFLLTTDGAIAVDAVKTETPEEKVPEKEIPEKKVVKKPVAKKK